MPVIVASIIPKGDQIDAVEAVLKDLIPAVHSEDGCEMYALHRGKDRLVFVEKWRDMEALSAHGRGDTMKELNKRLAGLVAGPPEVHVVDAVPVGDPEKGSV